MIDSEGYRPNVGIILCNEEGRLFWGKRIGQRSWQFPQGGIQRDESPEQAMFRELSEEVGLQPEHVQVIGCTKGWLRYRLPKRLVRRGGKPACVGQKQIWFLLRMLGNEEAVRLDLSERPEFDHWQWVDYWYPLRAVVPFKRHVYWRALRELAPLLRVGRPPRRTTHDFNSAEARPSAHSTSSVRASSARSSKVACESATVVQRTVVVLPLRRMEIGQHPVITRMVVSARRIGELETTPVAPVLESSAKASLDEARSPRPTASRSHRVSRR
ncbi:MAG: RNA pyrophosphohydrolase [Phycisphaerales bacterium]|nr:RNA pyrophosphohydrolase [Phycisphaerales bacterium]